MPRAGAFIEAAPVKIGCPVGVGVTIPVEPMVGLATPDEVDSHA